jgi:hypothetical protein
MRHEEKGVLHSELDRRALLKLPVEERGKLLARQAAALEDLYRPGSELMEWVEDYVDEGDLVDAEPSPR